MIRKKINPSRDFTEEIIIKTQNQKLYYPKNLKTKIVNKSLIEGSLVPNIPLKTIFGTANLHDYKSHNLIIFFYPKDNTPGCTIECEDFSKLHNDFLNLNTQVIGVSRDSIKSHEKFAKKFNLSINLIADETQNLCSLFNVIKEKNMYGKIVKGIERSTFFINSNFFIKKSWRGVRAQGHAEQVLDAVSSFSRNQL